MARSSWMTFPDLQLHRLQHHLLHCSSLTALPSLSDLRAPTLCWAQRDSDKQGLDPHWLARQTDIQDMERVMPGRGAGGLSWIWLDFGSQEDFLVEKVLLSARVLASITAPLKTVWVSCWASLPLLWTLARPFSTELWITHFVAQVTPFSGPPFPFNRWSPNPSACMWDRPSPPPQPGSTCISPKCFCSLLELFLCLGPGPCVYPLFDGYMLICQYPTQKPPLHETSLNSIFPFRITDLLL